jgi:hypothetical protein
VVTIVQKRRWILPFYVLPILLSLSARVASATLGHPESEIAGDQKSMQLSASRAGRERGYRFVSMSSPDFTVKQYVNPQTKVVFGVTWRGSRPPDFGILLGFDPAKVEGPRVYRSLRFAHIENSTLLLEFGGVPGTYVGRAVRLDLLPAGVSATEVMAP